jgi:hypothetical protein
MINNISAFIHNYHEQIRAKKVGNGVSKVHHDEF